MTKTIDKAPEFTMADPRELVLITDKKDPLYDPRVAWGVDPSFLKSFLHTGFTHGAISAIPGAKNTLRVVIGQRRTLHAKTACEILADPSTPAAQAILREAFPEHFTEKGKEEQAMQALIATLPKPYKIPVEVLRSRPDDETYRAKLVENLHRKDDPPLMEAQKMRHYMNLRLAAGAKKHGLTAEVAGIWGMTDDSVRNRLKLLEAPKPVRQALEAGEVKASDVLKHVDKDEDEQLKALKITKEEKAEKKGKQKRANVRVKATPAACRKAMEALGEGCTKKVPVLLALAWFAGEDKKGAFLKEIGVEL